jgi:hypothetical protein
MWFSCDFQTNARTLLQIGLRSLPIFHCTSGSWQCLDGRFPSFRELSISPHAFIKALYRVYRLKRNQCHEILQSAVTVLPNIAPGGGQASVFFFVGWDLRHQVLQPLLAYCTAPDDRWGWLWSNWWNEDWQGKPKYSEKTCPSATLSTTNPTW